MHESWLSSPRWTTYTQVDSGVCPRTLATHSPWAPRGCPGLQEPHPGPPSGMSDLVFQLLSLLPFALMPPQGSLQLFRPRSFPRLPMSHHLLAWFLTTKLGQSWKITQFQNPLESWPRPPCTAAQCPPLPSPALVPSPKDIDPRALAETPGARQSPPQNLLGNFSCLDSARPINNRHRRIDDLINWLIALCGNATRSHLWYLAKRSPPPTCSQHLSTR